MGNAIKLAASNFVRGGGTQNTVYLRIPHDVVIDSMFPFKGNDITKIRVTIKMFKDKLLIEK